MLYKSNETMNSGERFKTFLSTCLKCADYFNLLPVFRDQLSFLIALTSGHNEDAESLQSGVTSQPKFARSYSEPLDHTTNFKGDDLSSDITSKVQADNSIVADIEKQVQENKRSVSDINL